MTYFSFTAFSFSHLRIERILNGSLAYLVLVSTPLRLATAGEYDSLCLASGGIRLNECAVRPEICGNGRCVDTAGSYRCDCDPGYEVDPRTARCEGQLPTGGGMAGIG